MVRTMSICSRESKDHVHFLHENPWTMVRTTSIYSRNSKDHGPDHVHLVTKIHGPWSGPCPFLHENPWTMVRTTSIYSRKSKDHGPDFGLIFTKIHGPWSGPCPFIHENPRTMSLHFKQNIFTKMKDNSLDRTHMYKCLSLTFW